MFRKSQSVRAKCGACGQELEDEFETEEIEPKEAESTPYIRIVHPQCVQKVS